MTGLTVPKNSAMKLQQVVWLYVKKKPDLLDMLGHLKSLQSREVGDRAWMGRTGPATTIIEAGELSLVVCSSTILHFCKCLRFSIMKTKETAGFGFRQPSAVICLASTAGDASSSCKQSWAQSYRGESLSRTDRHFQKWSTL